MRKRWQVLSGISSFGVMSFVAVLALGYHTTTWFWLGLGGFAAACGVSLWAAITDYHGRWPAAVALATFAPFAELLIGGKLGFRGVSLFAFEVVICSVCTVVAAVVILALKVPPPRDSIAPARVL